MNFEDILKLAGIPVCAKEGCGMPALARIEITDENGTMWVDLCPMCLADAKSCLAEVAALRKERRQAIQQAEQTLGLIEYDGSGK